MQFTYDDIIKELCHYDHRNINRNSKYLNQCLENLGYNNIILVYIFNLVKSIDIKIKLDYNSGNKLIFNFYKRKKFLFELLFSENNKLFMTSIHFDINDHKLLNINDPNFEIEFQNDIKTILNK